MQPQTPGFSLVTVTPPEARLGFQIEIPTDWGQIAVPPEQVDFSNEGIFQPVAAFVAKYGAVLLTFSARPGLGDGSVADWVRRACQADKIEIGELSAAQAGSIPAVSASGTQDSEAGTMALRFLMFEQGAWLHTLMAMAPAAIWDSLVPTFDRMVASFAMTSPMAATVPLWPPGGEPGGLAAPAAPLPSPLAEARQAADRFLQAVQNNDEATARAMLITHEGETINFSSMSESARGYELGQPQAEGERVIIEVKLRNTPPGQSQPEEQTLPLVLCQADGTWKVDMGASINRMLGVDLEETMTQLAEGLGNAMAKGMESLATGLADGLASLSAPPSPPEGFWDVVAQVDQSVLPPLKDRMSQRLGWGLEVFVDWSSLGENVEAARRMGPLVVEPLAEAIDEMTPSDPERSRLLAVLDGVSIRHVQTPQERKCSLDGGQLEMAVCLAEPSGQEGPAGSFTVQEILKVLRSAIR